MTTVARTSNVSRAWLSEFLLTRGLTAPNEKPLYSYQVTQQELHRLRQSLTESKADFDNPVRSDSWAACFCLYVSERYRRDYDGSDGGWSWRSFESSLGVDFSPQQRRDLVYKGLDKFWKRPIRRRERGMDFLGSLFFEGGLPWKLVQSETHGFGRAVRGGLKQFYRIASLGRSTSDLMSDYVQYLPSTFRALETRQLLAGIIEQLIHLVEQHPLSGSEDPASYLDSHLPEWRSEFPIPLSEENGRKLVNEWLKDADLRKQEKKQAEENALELTCSHRLCGSPENWKIQSELILPKQHSFEIDTAQISSTRLELGFYEGNSLVAKGGAVYGALEGNKLSIKFPRTQISLHRKKHVEAISLKLLESGRVAHTFTFENSALETDNSPLVFEECEHHWQLVSNASCSLKGNLIRVRVPDGFRWPPDLATVLHEEEGGAVWIESRDNISIFKGNESFSFVLNSHQSDSIQLIGNASSYNSLPATVYFGRPQLRLPESFQDSIVSLREFSNGELFDGPFKNFVGTVHYSVKNKVGDTLLRRRFGLLPQGFKVSLYPASTYNPARVEIRSPVDLEISVICECARLTKRGCGDGNISFALEPTGKELPSVLKVCVVGAKNNMPLELSFPYPNEGAKLIDQDGIPVNQQDLQLDDLLGKSLLLTNAGFNAQRFLLHMELVGHPSPHPKKDYVVTVNKVPELVNLFAFYDDIVQMLAAVPEQDCYVHLSIDAGRPLTNFNIRRFNGHVKMQNSDEFTIEYSQHRTTLESPSVAVNRTGKFGGGFV